MNFMEWLKGEVCKCEIESNKTLLESNNNLVSKLKYANDVIYNANKDKATLAQQKIELENKVALLTGEVDKKNQAIESLKTELAINQVEPPSEYPNFLEEGKVYKPSIRLEDGTYMVIYDQKVMYQLPDILIDKVKYWRTLSEYDKLIKVWEYVIKALKYEYDKTDNWQFPIITVLREKGDCLPFDTYLLTYDGKLVEIKDISIGDEIIGYGGEKTKVKNKWKKGNLKIKKFYLSNKSLFRCTPDHKVFVIRDGIIIEKVASDLRVGDELLSIDTLKLKDNEIVDQDLLKLYGYHIADGWVGDDYRFSISGKDGFKKEEQKMWVKRFCEDRNLNYRWHERYITVNDKELTELMIECGHTAINKNIPFGLGMDEHSIIALLGGLRADACLRNNSNWVHRSISKKLITQIRILYKQLGIQTSIKYFVKHGGLGKNPIYDLTTRYNTYPITIEKIDDGDEVEVYDIETENKGIYLPESDIVVHNCEDGTILFVSLARAVGIPAHKIFNAIGPTAFGYHSYPIAYIDKDSGSTLSPGWYILESTLDFLPKQPKSLVGSQYWIDAGLQNWRYTGKIKDGFMNQFNGKKTAGPEKEQKIENSKEKIEAIIKYWKQKDT